MPGLARKLGWNAARMEPFDFLLRYSNCPVCRYWSYQSVGTVELTFIYSAGLLGVFNPGRCWRRPAPWAGAQQRQGRAPAPEDGESSRWLAWFWPASADSRARCRRSPCPKPHAGPTCSRLVHTHCPHVCSASASPDDPRGAVRTAPFEAQKAPGNLLQGEIKNQT